MCGILGSNFGHSDKIFNESVKLMLDRGPDNQNVINVNDFKLGHTRLSIIDLSDKANQPMQLGEYTVIYNGEIYNYKHLIKKYNIKCNTNSDTEALLKLFMERKEKILEELDGMFAFAVYNEKEKYLFLARDSIGEKPLYYLYKYGKLIFSSTIKPIKKLYTDLTLNKQAIWDYFSFLWIPEPDTVYKEIKALPKGNYLYFKNGNISINKFNFKFSNKEKDICITTKKLVTKAITDRTLSDVKIGTFLSGGLDSSIVTAVVAKEIKNIDVFTIGFDDGFEPYTGFADETEYAKCLTKKLELNHHIIRVNSGYFRELLYDYINALDQPFAVSSALGILAVSRYAKKLGVKVLLSGDGADESFGGYTWYPKLKYNNMSVFSDDKPKGWHYYMVESEKEKLLNKNFFEDVLSSTRFLPNTFQPKDFIEHDKYFYLSNEMMTKLDRMTMANSIEGRAVFVAPYLLQFTSSISYDILLKNGLKWLLKQSFVEILPKRIIERKKHGFNPPVYYWFNNEWSDLLKKVFDQNSFLIKTNIFSDITYDNFKDIFQQDKRFGDIAFQLLILNKWLEENL